MNRISIIGMSGSGKSTLANRLGRKLDLPVFHLDKFFWTTDWKEQYATNEEFTAIADNFASKDKWIIDGNYRSSNLDLRLERADTIIFLDFPKWRCLWRVFIRGFNKKRPFDRAEGFEEKNNLSLVKWSLLKWIMNYKIDEMRERVIKYKDKKTVLTARNNREIESLLLTLSK